MLLPWHRCQIHIVAEKKLAEEAEEKEKEKEKEKEEDKGKDGDKEGNKEDTKEASSEQPAKPLETSRVVPDVSGESSSSSCSKDSEVDPITATAKQTKSDDAKIGTLEKIFSVMNVDKCLCLLAAILPQELSVSVYWGGGKEAEMDLSSF